MEENDKRLLRVKEELEKLRGNKGGIPLLPIVAAVLITLKIVGAVSWPWVWVLAPVWIPFVIALLLTLVIAHIVANKDLD